MKTQLVLHFDNVEEFNRVWQLLKENGLEKLAFQTKPSRTKPKPKKREWAFGIGNLGGKLDHVNIRDYARED